MASCSDLDMKMASAISYIHGLTSAVRSNPDKCIQEILKDNTKAANDFKKNYPDLYEMVMADGSKYGDWKIKKCYDQNDDNGFYGCLIETGDNEAIIGFRGSENITNSKNLLHDWIEADAGLLNSVQTEQQRCAEEMMRDIEKNYSQYDNISITGHSLGGNLAMHAAITASDSMYKKLNRVLSIDGPGFSDEYLKYHKEEIEKHSRKIDHYQCSVVGALLNSVPGTNYKSIESRIPEGEGYFSKHSLPNIVTEDGSFVAGMPDDLSIEAHALTNSLDDNTVGEGIVGALYALTSLVSNPIKYRAHILLDGIGYLYKYKKEAKKKYKERVENKSTQFVIKTANVRNSIETIHECESMMSAIADEVLDIKEELNIFVKLASVFTISYKLKKSASNLNRLSELSRRIYDSGIECIDIYERHEENIISNA